MDQRGRDAPPVFYIPVQIAGYKYHALLTEPIWSTTKLVLEVFDTDRGHRSVDGQTAKYLVRGLYGFRTVEERDKFIRRINGESDAEAPICLAVTIPNLYMDEPMVSSIRYQTTEPVAEPSTQPNGD